MKIDLYDEIKSAVKDALKEFYKDIKNQTAEHDTQQHDVSEGQRQEILLTVKQFCKKNPFITEGGIRSRIFSREYNKFDKCLSKVGRKILIKEKSALEWFSNPPPEASWTYDQKKYGSK